MEAIQAAMDLFCSNICALRANRDGTDGSIIEVIPYWRSVPLHRRNLDGPLGLFRFAHQRLAMSAVSEGLHW